MELRGTGDSAEKTKLVQSETVHSPQSGSQRRFEEWGLESSRSDRGGWVVMVVAITSERKPG